MKGAWTEALSQGRSRMAGAVGCWQGAVGQYQPGRWQPLNGKKEKGKLGLGRLDRKKGDRDGKGKIGGTEENQISSFVLTIPMTIIIISVATNVLIASPSLVS